MSVAKDSQQPQQVSHRDEDDGSEVVSHKEQSASAGGSAGINLNIFGAVAGAFSGKSSKETQEDGSEVKHSEKKAGVRGAGAGNMDAKAAAGAQKHASEERRLE
ncbi:hypothetical protein MBLNU230_g3650t1 [Neophaeotheca triangularis]